MSFNVRPLSRSLYIAGATHLLYSLLFIHAFLGLEIAVIEYHLVIRRAYASDVATIVALLQTVDLLTHDVLAPNSYYWVAEDQHQQLVGVAGVEVDQTVALLRSVAVPPHLRNQGVGKVLVRHALDFIRAAGCERVYLFSTRSGSYWQRLGFDRVPVEEVAQMLPTAPQVLRFHAIGKLARETAWRKDLVQAPSAKLRT